MTEDQWERLAELVRDLRTEGSERLGPREGKRLVNTRDRQIAVTLVDLVEMIVEEALVSGSVSIPREEDYTK